MILLRKINSDYNKYKKYGGTFITIFFFTQGFWAIFQYRIAHEVF
ncbi:serine acetyltransferase, partial [Flavobacterium davisii]